MFTGGEAVPLLICLDIIKLVLLSVFTLIEAICSKNSAKPQPNVHFWLTCVAKKNLCLSSLVSGVGFDSRI